MTPFVVTGSGVVNLSNQDFPGFDSIAFQTSGDTTVILKSTQIGPDVPQLGTDTVFIGSGFVDRIEMGIELNATFVGSSFSFQGWSFNDGFDFFGNTGNENITGTQGNDRFFIGQGQDNVDGNLGTNDILIVQWGWLTTSVRSNTTILTDFAGTSVTYTNIDRLNVTTGSGDDQIVTRSGADTIRSGTGNDTLDSGAGQANVDGGTGIDLWAANFSTDGTSKSVDLALAGRQSAGNGTVYAGIERLNLVGGAAADFFASRHSTVTETYGDTLNGGAGNDTLVTGGGDDVVDGGADEDTLIIDYASANFSFGMNNAIITNFSGTSTQFVNIEHLDIRLGSGNDQGIGGALADTLSGGDGNDTLNSAQGAATVDGGLGVDLWAADFSGDGTAKVIDLGLGGTQLAGNGSQYTGIERLSMLGGAGADLFASRHVTITETYGDTINGGGGNDTIVTGGGDDVVDGGADEDTLIVDYSTATSHIGMNTSIITNFAGTSTQFVNIEHFDLRLGSGNDEGLGGALADTLSGGAGDDTLNSAQGAATVDGGLGVDIWAANFSDDATAKVIDLGLAGLQTAGNGSKYIGIERLAIVGGAAGDLFASRHVTIAEAYGDTIIGGAGNDTIVTGGGDDVVDGGADEDTLIVDYSTATTGIGMNTSIITNFAGTSTQYSNIEHFDIRLGSANDQAIGGAFADTISGGKGNDTLNTAGGEAVVDGGQGNDLWAADFSGSAVARVINLRSGVLQHDGADTTYRRIETMNITGSNLGDTLTTRVGGGGRDTVNGGGGDDTIRVGGGDDVANGGIGDDLLIVDYAHLSGNIGMNTTIITNFAGTSVQYAGFERLQLLFGAGADQVFGVAGNDTLSGGDGADTIVGGLGADSLTGGNGADVFRFFSTEESTFAAAGRDVITDFDTNGDKIDLSGMDAIVGGGRDAFTWIGGAAFGGLGELRVFQAGGNTIIQGNTTGNLAPDFQITLRGLITIDQLDFNF